MRARAGYNNLMQEIEIKAVLKDREEIMRKLESLGCTLSDPIRQDDVIYVEHTGPLETFLSNRAFLRIRVNNGNETIFTAKQKRGALVAIEHEVVVDSKGELEQMLGMMGYQKALEIHKTRLVTEYQGCEICIDEVEGLGTFIEMEKLSKDGDAETIQEELFKFFETLGISRADRVTKGYDILLLEKA